VQVPSILGRFLEVPRSVSLEQAHLASIEAKNVVQNLVERSDVIIHLDPMVQDRTSIIETIHSVAARHGLGVHSIRVHDAHQAVELEMHIEVPENLDVASAHRRVSMFEAGLCKEVENVTEVVTHIEPCGDKESHHKVVVEDSEDLRHRIMEIVCECAGIEDCHNFTIYRENGDLCVSFHCNVCSDLSISEAHSLTARIERQLMLEIPELENVVIHVEPFEDADRITTE
jgi:divalent metal cation (Fe/Co/Zn/Cd) transporter